MRWLPVVLAVVLLVVACGEQSASPQPGPVPMSLPALDVTVVADGLDHPWDVVAAPDGTLLTGERGGRFVAVRPGGERRELRADLSDLFVGSETGLMDIALATDFATSRKLFSCQGIRGDTRQIGVVAWTVDPDWTALTRTGTLISGFPVSSGRHGGCRILPRPDGTVLIGTGDSARPTVSQDMNSLGGKVLRVDAGTGAPAAGNPFGDSPVYTLGHRNIQGLVVRPGTDQIYTVEHGPTRDDEVNLLQPGGNYGWQPDRDGRGDYDESVPMTDLDRLPNAIGAVWTSGSSTIATGGLDFVTGPAWGAWNGSLAVGALKGQRVVLLRLAEDGRSVDEQATPPELLATFGRIRSVSAQPDGSLLLTTDNGSDDKILRAAPRG